MAEGIPRARARSLSSLQTSGARRTLIRASRLVFSGTAGAGGVSNVEVRSTTSSSCFKSVDSLIPSPSASARTRALVSEVTRQMMKAPAATSVIVIRQHPAANPAFLGFLRQNSTFLRR